MSEIDEDLKISNLEISSCQKVFPMYLLFQPASRELYNLNNGHVYQIEISLSTSKNISTFYITVKSELKTEK